MQKMFLVLQISKTYVAKIYDKEELNRSFQY